MAHAFKTISAKPTFGTLKENLYQSDYINRKKRILTICNSNIKCNGQYIVPSYNTINLFNLGRHSLGLDECNKSYINKDKTNLIAGQYTIQNLSNVCTVSVIDQNKQPPSYDYNPCQNSVIIIDPNNTSTNPFYFTNQIDPLGELFGRTQCGELNYTNYMEKIPK